ncbi:hypothetical protein N7466_005150 [Penicillium verhagenii]|uniref:uncharacterized protein n=1 Tax=Penicillium verhagenii TaxID=1562060 RepID=UPI0025457A1A|nr:uncharacterized protein N7466_005150 [Penicillium verhagenii]KAJ5935603.1 hypothetical protein N7466_005150 [Penicillium verhagenii]
MLFQAFLPLILASLAAASPAAIGRRQYIDANDLTDGDCKDTMFIFARGSTESGNMGTVVGPEVCDDLKTQLDGELGCQGVGGAYGATLATNFLPADTSTADIEAAVSVFNECNTKCPNAKIVAGGYSQGTAVMDGAIQKLSDEVVAKVKGVVLFGFTRNLQDKGRIPGYPTNQTKVYCAIGDEVCDGTLIITAAHLTYGDDASSAATFLASTLE